MFCQGDITVNNKMEVQAALCIVHKDTWVMWVPTKNGVLTNKSNNIAGFTGRIGCLSNKLLRFNHELPQFDVAPPR
jgi:hypothetical protein